MMVWLLASLFIVIAFITDVKENRIPNWLTVAAACIGIGLHVYMAGWEGVKISLLGLLCGLLLSLPLYIFRALGAGDVKLFGALGALTEAGFVVYAFTASLVVAGVVAVIILFWRGEFKRRVSRIGFSLYRLLFIRDTKVVTEWTCQEYAQQCLHFPFMWAVLPGTIYAWTQWGW